MDSGSGDIKADILLLITDLGVGGAQKVFRDQADLLAERYRVTEVVFDLDGAPAFPGKNRLVSLGVSGGGGPLRKLRNFAERVRHMRRLKKASGARLCISHLPGADYVNLLSRVRGTKTITVAHGSRLNNRESQSAVLGRLAVRGLEPPLYSRADMVVPVSEALRTELWAMGIPAEKLQSIVNFFKHEEIRSLAEHALSAAEESLFGDRPVIATIGRLSQQKNHLGLLHVFAEVIKERPARLVIIGDGPLRKQLVARSARLGLSHWAAWEERPLEAGHDVYFIGNVANPFRWLSRADLFVLSSDWEGFPLALCEAMILGLPVVSADCPTGPREILAPDSRLSGPPIEHAEHARHGVLMPLLASAGTESHCAWVTEIARLLDSPAERDRYGKAAAERADDFTRERIGAQWFALVERVLAEP